jgi:hypothetical protein
MLKWISNSGLGYGLIRNNVMNLLVPCQAWNIFTTGTQFLKEVFDPWNELEHNKVSLKSVMGLNKNTETVRSF